MNAPQDAQATAFEKEGERLAQEHLVANATRGILCTKTIEEQPEHAAHKRAFLAGRASLRKELAEKDARIRRLESLFEVEKRACDLNIDDVKQLRKALKEAVAGFEAVKAGSMSRLVAAVADSSISKLKALVGEKGER